jgi:predicted Zn-dependent protease with MMP-like domain
MINLSEEEWNRLFDAVDATVLKAIDDLPEPTKVEAWKFGCGVEKYNQMECYAGHTILGVYMANTHGPIIIYVGQIFEANNQNLEETMKSVRQVYYHELAHAVGNLEEYEVKARGL